MAVARARRIGAGAKPRTRARREREREREGRASRPRWQRRTGGERVGLAAITQELRQRRELASSLALAQPRKVS